MGEQTVTCPQKFCSEHPHTVERLAGMEAKMEGISETIQAGVTEFKELKKEISGRPSWGVLMIISFLGSALTLFATLYLKG